MPEFTLTDKLLLTLYLIILCAAYVLYILWSVRMVRLQIHLAKSDQLVKLRSNKWWYALLFVSLAAVLGWFIYKTVNTGLSKERLIFSLLVGGLMAVLAIKAFCRSAVVEDGVYLTDRFIPWNKCYDYYIDKEKCTISFSNNIKGGLTLVGTTFPKKFAPEDTDKLLSILESKKDRFLTNIIVR